MRRLWPLVLLLLAGCTTVTPPNGRVTTLGHKEFREAQFEGQLDMYQTSGAVWVCILKSTAVVGGEFADLRPGFSVAYNARWSSWIKDSQGFSHFCWIADSVTILKGDAAFQVRRESADDSRNLKFEYLARD